VLLSKSENDAAMTKATLTSMTLHSTTVSAPIDSIRRHNRATTATTMRAKHSSTELADSCRSSLSGRRSCSSP
jgi:hypothetical protein